MINFIRKRTVIVLAFVFAVLSALLYQIPLLNNAIKTIIEEMADSGQDAAKATNVYGFKVKDLDGNVVDMEKYRGKVLIIVNTATNCGLTKNNIKELNEVYEKFKESQFQILGFPSNSFNQELDCDTDIKEFVKKNKIEWDYFGKVSVNGDNTEPLFKYLKAATAGMLGKFIKWNFTKFLVNKEGVAIKRYSPTDSPSKIIPEIDKLLSS